MAPRPPSGISRTRFRVDRLHEHNNISIASVQLPAANTPHFDVMRTLMPRKLMTVPPVYEPEAVEEAIMLAAKHAPRELVVG